MTHGSNITLIEDLLECPGNRLIISAGYLTWFEDLPFNRILNCGVSIELVVGAWKQDTPALTEKRLLELKRNVKAFAGRVKQEADEYGIQKPDVTTYLVPSWHAKVALMVDRDLNRVSGAVIGSSNISSRALGLTNSESNIEVDVLINDTDGPDAQVELNLLLLNLEPIFTKKFYVKF
ncbi:hypothetical protein thsbcT34_73960 [Burkholderia contaminans]|nr:hypothetical protein SK875_C00985 [Burkholderia contaminans]